MNESNMTIKAEDLWDQRMGTLEGRVEHIEKGVHEINGNLLVISRSIAALEAKFVIAGEGPICKLHSERVQALSVAVSELKAKWAYSAGVAAFALVLLTFFGPFLRHALGLEPPARQPQIQKP